MPGRRVFLRNVLFIAAATITTTSAGLVTVQANDPSIQYSTNVNWARSEACGGTMYSFGVDQSFSFNFTGTSVSLVGTQDSYGGVVTVALDGVSTDYNRYSSQSGYDPLCNKVIFQQSGLQDAAHTLIVTHTGSNSGFDMEEFFEWQYLTYTSTAKSSNVGAIAGGVGGAIGALLLVGAAWFFLFRKRRQRQAVDLGGSPTVDEHMQQAQIQPYPIAPVPRLGPSVDHHAGASGGAQQAAIHGVTSMYSTTDGRDSTNRTSFTSSGVQQDQQAPWAPTVPPKGAGGAIFAPPMPVMRHSSISKASSTEFNPYNAPPPSSSRGPGTTATSSSGRGDEKSQREAMGLVSSSPASSTSRPSPQSRLLGPDLRNVLPPLSDPDLDRLAARVATMMAAGTQPQTQTQPDAAQPPPPVVNRRPSVRSEHEEAPPQYSQSG